MIGPSPSSGEDSAGLPRPVIVTKVRPPLRRRDLVSRPRLIEYLTDNVDRKLILVSAAAGYGKTTLVVDFIHESGIPACWYSLDEGDSDLTVFLEHLVASLRQRYPGVCEQTLMQLRSNTHPDHEALVGSLINEITEGVDDFFLLVLDDFHKLDDSVLINASLDFLLRYLPDNCRLVVCSRTLPKKLTLTRLAGEGQVLGVGQEHLRFGRGEIRDLVRHLHHEELTDEELEKLAEASEGWIAALVMGSSKLLDGVRTGLDLPTAKSGQLFEYLAQEVMDQLPADVQAFLLQTAILQVLNADVCDAVTGRTDSAAMLEHLEEQNLYLGRIEGEELWYRFHGLFHDFLQARLAEEGLSDELVERHLRAASWYADHDEPESEIHHLLEADRFEEAAVKMVGQLRPAAASGRWRLIVRWVTSLPEEVRREWPDLLASLGVAYSYLGRLPESIAVEGQALQAFQEQGDDKGAALALMHRSYSWRFVGQVDAAMEDSARALELASDPDGYVASSVHRNLGACLSLRGDMVAAASELRLALESFEAGGRDVDAAQTHSDLSAMYQLSGNVARAYHHAKEARDYFRRIGNVSSLALALNNMGTALHAMGRLEEARDVLEEAVSTARRGGVRRTEGLVLASLGDVQSDLDEFAAAMDSYDVSLRRARDTGEGTMVCYCLASIAEAQRLAGELDSAHSYIAEARQELAANRSAFEAALVDYVRGTIALDRREYERAVEHLEDAARSFSKMSACREQARAMLYRVATSHRSGDMADADLHWSQAKSLMQKFGYRQAFEPQVRRLPEVFAREAIHDVTPPRGNGAEDAAAAVAVAQGEQPATGDGLGPGGGTAAPIELAVRAFGVPAVEVNGRPVGKGEWETAAAQELFFFLVDRPGGVGRDDVLLAFWPESTMPRATSAFHSTLHRVRQAVGKGTIGHQGERYFVPQGCLAAYDVAEFEACVAAAADVPDQEAVTLLSRAADLAAGDYLQGVSADWARDRSTGLRAAAVETAMRLGRLHLAASRPEAAAEAYERALELEPLEEEAHRSLMLVQAKAGHRTKALQQYDRLRELLAAELGVDPDPTTRALYEAIKTKDSLPAG